MIPGTINICGIPHSIKISSDDFNIDAEHFGTINYKKCEIHISSDMPEAMQMQTLIHEWVHGALFAIGYDDLRGDEKLVQNLAMAINQTFVIERDQ